MATSATGLTAEQITQFHERGYIVARGLYGPDEVRELRDTFMTMHAGGPIPGCFAPTRREPPRDDRTQRGRVAPGPVPGEAQWRQVSSGETTGDAAAPLAPAVSAGGG